MTRHSYSLRQIANLKGYIGEFVARDFLEAYGFKIVGERGYIIDADGKYDLNGWGCLDIQAEKDGKQYDIEVKYGKSARLERYNKPAPNAIFLYIRVSGDLNENKWTINLRKQNFTFLLVCLIISGPSKHQ